jgi:hypothetical protein
VAYFETVFDVALGIKEFLVAVCDFDINVNDLLHFGQYVDFGVL